MSLCPLPFIPQPAGMQVSLDLASSPTTCFGGCCVPCPYQGLSPNSSFANGRNIISFVYGQIYGRRYYERYLRYPMRHSPHHIFRPSLLLTSKLSEDMSRHIPLHA